MSRSILIAALLVSVLSGCGSRCSDRWEDCRTAGRYMRQGFRTLSGGGEHCSRQVCSREDFCRGSVQQGNQCVGQPNWNASFTPRDNEEIGYIPVGDEEEWPVERATAVALTSAPSAEAKRAVRSASFANVHFPYNSSLIEGEENLDTVRAIAGYMRQNPRYRIFVEGHCDERGAEAYNMALGLRRANAVKSLLVRHGVASTSIETISYGRERPLVSGHDERTWSLNRRAEFRVDRS